MSNQVNTKTGPDALLANIGRSIMAKAMFVSILGHLVFTAATSTSLVQDWFRCQYCGQMATDGTCPQNQREVKDPKDGTVKYVCDGHERFGFHSPSYLNGKKAEIRKTLEAEKRRRETIEKAQREAEAAAAAAAAAATNKQTQAKSPKKPAEGAKDGAAAKGAEGAKAAEGAKDAAAKKDGAKGADGKVTPPEIKPMERAKDFQYGDELDL